MTETTKHTVIRVAVVGASGFLGGALVRGLVRAGVQVVAYCRRALPEAPGVRWHAWRQDGGEVDLDGLDGADAVINLVGRRVDCIKTPAHCAQIMDSRVDSVRKLGGLLRQCQRPPGVWLQASTAHIVGDPTPLDAVCDEATPPGEGLAPRVATAWEAAAREVALPGQRLVLLRTSFVLGHGGAALRRLGLVTRWGLGGTVGHGRQWVSWLHIDDFVTLATAMLTDPAFEGVYMVTAPQPVTNREMMRAFRRAYRRPWAPPAPAWAVRLVSHHVMRTDPELALLGRRVVPRRLLDEHGWTFRYPTIDAAVADLAGRDLV